MSTDSQPLLQDASLPNSDGKEAPRSDSSATATANSSWTDEKALKWLQKNAHDFDSLSAEVGPLRRSALHFASFTGQPDLIKYLLTRGERLERRDTSGKNSLHLACEADRVDNIKMILGHCIRNNDEDMIDSRDDALQTPIMITCIRGYSASLRIFMSRYRNERKPKVDLWLKDAEGCTALHHAAHHGHTKCAELLLANVEDPKAYILEKNSKGQTSKDLATSHRSTFKLLEERSNALLAEMDKTLWLTVIAFAFIAIGLVSGLVISAFYLE